MKNVRLNILLFFVVAITTWSCGGSDDVDPAESLKGRWNQTKYEQKAKKKGGTTQTESSEINDANIYFEFDGNGTAKQSDYDEDDKVSVSESKYKISGSTITFEYSEGTQKYTEDYTYEIKDKSLVMTQSVSQTLKTFKELKALVKDDKDASSYIDLVISELSNYEIYDSIITCTKK
jgi:hypothetical protein